MAGSPLLASALLPLVETVERDRPGLALVLRLLPELAHAIRPHVEEGHPPEHVLAPAVGAGRRLLRRVVEVAVPESTVVLGDAAGAVDPGLLPALLLGVVDVEALAHVTVGARPVLEDDAVVQDLFDPARP